MAIAFISLLSLFVTSSSHKASCLPIKKDCFNISTQLLLLAVSLCSVTLPLGNSLLLFKVHKCWKKRIVYGFKPRAAFAKCVIESMNVMGENTDAIGLAGSYSEVTSVLCYPYATIIVSGKYR